MNSQFKFKPDKIKYLSNVDTLDSTHKKITGDINKKREDVDKKLEKLIKLKNQLENIDSKKNELIDTFNYIEVRANLIDNISKLEEEIKHINNYDEETEYYSKTYQILFNYYDMLDGQIENEINNTCDDSLKTNDIGDMNNLHNTNCVNELNNFEHINNMNDDKMKNDDTTKNEIDEWNLDGTQIFSSGKKSILDTLYESSKKKRKEKKNTRKRVKNVEMLIKDNNYDIFEFINSNVKNNSTNDIGNNTTPITNKVNSEYDVYDRAKLYDDYKISLEGYNSKKKYSKICENCNIDKVLIYSEGIYACMNCGEVENCIIESEITNYKEPMIEKPTFPYKRKNHFCELKFIQILLTKVIYKKNGYFLHY